MKQLIVVIALVFVPVLAHAQICTDQGGGGGGPSIADILNLPCQEPAGTGVSDPGEILIYCAADNITYISENGSGPTPLLGADNFIQSLPGVTTGCLMEFASSAGNVPQESELCVDAGVLSYPGIVRVGQIVPDSRAATNDNRIEMEKNIGNPTCPERCAPGLGCTLYNQDNIRQCDGINELSCVGTCPP